MIHAFLIFIHRAHTDKGFAASGGRSAYEKIKLSARAADLSGARTFRRHLTIQIHRDTTVNRNHIVNLGNHARSVDILQRIRRDAVIVVHPFIQLRRANGTAKHPFALVNIFSFVGELSCFVHTQIRIGTKLCVHAQILEVGLCNQFSQRIRHTANPKLQRRTIYKIGQKLLRNPSVNFRRHNRLAPRKRFMFPLHDIIHVRNMDTLVIAAMHFGQMLIHFDDHKLSHARNRRCDTRIDRKIKIPVLIHRRDTDHRNVDF